LFGQQRRVDVASLSEGAALVLDDPGCLNYGRTTSEDTSNCETPSFHRFAISFLCIFLFSYTCFVVAPAFFYIHILVRVVVLFIKWSERPF
jgi:hypothetical protein